MVPLATGVLAGVGLAADRYSAVMLSRILVVGLLAASVAVLAGWCGLPSLGQTAPFAVGAYATGLLARDHQLAGPVLLAAAALAGAGFATATGPIVLRTRGTVFLMVTLAVGELVTTAASRWAAVTGGSDGLVAIPATRLWPGAPPLLQPRDVYLYVLAVVVVTVLVTLAVLRSPYGLLLRAVRDNESRMRAAGHHAGRYLLVAYVGAGAIAALSGSLLVTTQRYVSPADVGFDVAALVLLAVVIGGASSLVGAFAGAALIVATRDWLAGPWPGHAPLLVGALLVVAVYALPDGFAGRLARLRSRFLEGERGRAS
jgi:branched-chain amino acid transport system permease protein